jgi:anti-anti-sigma factor
LTDAAAPPKQALSSTDTSKDSGALGAIIPTAIGCCRLVAQQSGVVLRIIHRPGTLRSYIGEFPSILRVLYWPRLEVEFMTKRMLSFSSEKHVGTHHEMIIYKLFGNLRGSPHAYEFQEELRGKIADGLSRIVIDLENVEKIDSAGLGILASVMWSASQAGGGMVLASIPPIVEKLLGIAMLLDRIERADTREAAIAMLDQA